MFWTIAFEILFLWVCYAAYMAVLVHKRGPVGGLFFYPQVMIDRVKSLGLITEAEFRKRKRFAYILLIAWMLVIPGVMILWINRARSWWDCCWQFYALFLGAEFFDWMFIDTFPFYLFYIIGIRNFRVKVLHERKVFCNFAV